MTSSHSAGPRLVDVGGFRLHLECAGEGTPTVVLEAGGACGSGDWDPVWPQLVAVTRTCRYDRAGLGGSDRSPHPRTARRMAAELHELLRGAGIPPPYVLVGHSFGAWVVRMFAGTYPAEVAGLVLVDGAQEDLEERMQPFLSDGGRRLWRESWDPSPDDVDNPEDVSYARAHEIQVGLRTTGRRLPDVPLVVLTAGSVAAKEAEGPPWVPAADFVRVSREIGAELARLTSRGEHVVAERSGHFIHRDQPDLVVEAVRRVVHGARPPPRRFP